VLAQIEKTRELLPGDDVPVSPDCRDVRLWRNVVEHWEDDDGPSLGRLRQSEPESDSWPLRYGGSHTTIGHLSTEQVRDGLARVLLVAEDASVRDGQVVRRADDPVYDESRPAIGRLAAVGGALVFA
jgi:hypothetical protein